MVLGLGRAGLLPPKPQRRTALCSLQRADTCGEAAAPHRDVGTPSFQAEPAPVSSDAHQGQQQQTQQAEVVPQLQQQLQQAVAAPQQLSTQSRHSARASDGERGHSSAAKRPQLQGEEGAGPGPGSQAQQHGSGDGPSRGRRRRSASATPASASKRAKRAAAGGGGSALPHAGLIGMTVEVPGKVFFTKTPFYIGEVVKPDRHRRVPAVEVRFLDDNSLYWFPLAEVVEWAAAMKRRGSWRRFNPCSLADALAEGRGEEVKAAAAVLQSLTASGLTAGAGGGQQQAAACNSDGRRAGSVTPA